MREKTTIALINGGEYQIGRMAPDIGAFILNRLIAAGVEADRRMAESQAQAPPPPARAADEAQATQATPEDTVRTLCAAAFFRTPGFDLETYRIVQRATISVCSRMEGEPTQKVPMPMMNAAGQWAIADVRDDIGLVSKLMTEVMVFNLKSFFEQAGVIPAK